VIAAAGIKKRELSTTLPAVLPLPDTFINPKIALPGILILQGKNFETYEKSETEILKLQPHWKVLKVEENSI
jgi:4-hydroxy-3-polyprenylbenzoate decarboxylase